MLFPIVNDNGGKLSKGDNNALPPSSLLLGEMSGTGPVGTRFFILINGTKVYLNDTDFGDDSIRIYSNGGDIKNGKLK